jgi:hypothetical protein
MDCSEAEPQCKERNTMKMNLLVIAFAVSVCHSGSGWARRCRRAVPYKLL